MGSALLRILYVIPSLFVLALLVALGSILWLLALILVLVSERYPESVWRFLCGIGISHQPFIDRVKSSGTYAKPVATMAAFLDGLDAAAMPLRPEDRVIAALGPKMLELARERTAGTHPSPKRPVRRSMRGACAAIQTRGGRPS